MCPHELHEDLLRAVRPPVGDQLLEGGSVADLQRLLAGEVAERAELHGGERFAGLNLAVGQLGCRCSVIHGEFGVVIFVV